MCCLKSCDDQLRGSDFHFAVRRGQGVRSLLATTGKQVNLPSELKLWDFISCNDFEIPRSPTEETARSHSRRLWHWLKYDVLGRPNPDTESVADKRSLPSPAELTAVAVEPDWCAAAEALGADLDHWLENIPSATSVRALVGPPESGTADVLRTLVEQRQLKVLTPPPVNILLDDPEAHEVVLQSLDEATDELLVVPSFENFYLRHQNGTAFVRQVVERLLRRPVLLGCDSWAWAFLQQAIGIEDTLGKPITLAAFDGHRLDAWLRSHYDLQVTEFRQSRDNQPVFPSRSAVSPGDQHEPEQEVSTLIKSLAARARGNLGVALALWCSGLRTRDPQSKQSEPSAAMSRQVYWVVAPSERESAMLSEKLRQSHRFILHAILLHGGLPPSLLFTLLPLSPEDITRGVSELKRAGLIHEQQGILKVALTEYPEIRQNLVDEGFLVDAYES